MEGRRRPLGIWVIVVLQLVNAVVTVADVAFGTSLMDHSFQRLAEQDALVRVVVVSWAGLVLLASIWLWMLSRRGWALMMLLVGVGLAAHLAIWWLRPDDTQWVRMTLSAIAAFYLNSSAVRQRFLQRHVVSRIAIGERTSA